MNSSSLHRIFAPLLVLAATSLVGCFQLGDFTEGVEGRAHFSTIGDSCFFGCALRPLPPFERVILSIDGDDLPEGLLVAADPDVLVAELETHFSCCERDGNGTTCSSGETETACQGDLSVSYLARVQTRSPGSTPFILITREGAVFDWVSITVGGGEAAP